ncbi:hypothetical protein F503_04045 [Ophiostoma piceae UAMH 11346]|uniref:Uncharacterized protein n=1 Tax=Ophiostoma piceae (strain UAMH 11346) TaxID=1262450 RepID=S3BTI3_OPHP1|nr:hypothetical protein F503_04045 [Ophiostoma piceae UAMH 11346]
MAMLPSAMLTLIASKNLPDLITAQLPSIIHTSRITQSLLVLPRLVGISAVLYGSLAECSVSPKPQRLLVHFSGVCSERHSSVSPYGRLGYCRTHYEHI